MALNRHKSFLIVAFFFDFLFLNACFIFPIPFLLELFLPMRNLLSDSSSSAFIFVPFVFSYLLTA
ncbi:hypothetical protein M413DRAFT_445575 [Hebeloma cylindrosporum]|uniref:Uncharacterized protein n=1 Tax=Hebeloma cylindrosporum TaxID=76867 RepID=A0A0C3CBM0_HEBCY|nr:hypothetical protein M413DRAFT_445575 [Hebeloma cylindrosporum h7]